MASSVSPASAASCAAAIVLLGSRRLSATRVAKSAAFSSSLSPKGQMACAGAATDNTAKTAHNDKFLTTASLPLPSKAPRGR